MPQAPQNEQPDVLRPATESSVQSERQPFVVKPYPAIAQPGNEPNPALNYRTQAIKPPESPEDPSKFSDLDSRTIANATAGDYMEGFTPVQPFTAATAPGQTLPANVYRYDVNAADLSIANVLARVTGANAQSLNATPSPEQLRQATYIAQSQGRYMPTSPYNLSALGEVGQFTRELNDLNAQTGGYWGDSVSADPAEDMRTQILQNLPLVSPRGLNRPGVPLSSSEFDRPVLPPAQQQPTFTGQEPLRGRMDAARQPYRDEQARIDRGAMRVVESQRTNLPWTWWMARNIGNALGGVRDTAVGIWNNVAETARDLTSREALDFYATASGNMIPNLPADVRAQQDEKTARFMERLFGAPQAQSVPGVGNQSAAQSPRQVANFREGYWGDYGSGVFGAGLYTLNALQTALGATVYTVTDNIWRAGAFLSGRPQPTHLNLPDANIAGVTIPGWVRSWVGERRFREGFGDAVDLSFANVRDQSRYLSTLDPNRPMREQVPQFAGGLFIDMVLGGGIDNAMNTALRNYRRTTQAAARTAGSITEATREGIRSGVLPNEGRFQTVRPLELSQPQRSGLTLRVNEREAQQLLNPNYDVWTGQTLSRPPGVPSGQLPPPITRDPWTILEPRGITQYQDRVSQLIQQRTGVRNQLAGSLSVGQATRGVGASASLPTQVIGANTPGLTPEALQVISPMPQESLANTIRGLSERRAARQEFNAKRPSDQALNNFADGAEPLPPEPLPTGQRVEGARADQLNNFADNEPVLSEGAKLELINGGRQDLADLFDEEFKLQQVTNPTPEQQARLQTVSQQLDQQLSVSANEANVIDNFREIEQRFMRTPNPTPEQIKEYEDARTAFRNLNRGDRSGNVVPLTRPDGRPMLQTVTQNPQSPYYFRPRLANENDLPSTAPVRGMGRLTDQVNGNLIPLRREPTPENVVDIMYGRNRRSVELRDNTLHGAAAETLGNIVDYIDNVLQENAEVLARYADDPQNPTRYNRDSFMWNDEVRSYRESGGFAEVELRDGTVERVPIADSNQLVDKYGVPRIDWERDGVARAMEILDDPIASEVYYNDAVRTLDDGLPSDPSLLGLSEDGVELRPTQSTPTPQQTVAAAVLKGDIVQTTEGTIIERSTLERQAATGISRETVERARAALENLPDRRSVVEQIDASTAKVAEADAQAAATSERAKLLREAQALRKEWVESGAGWYELQAAIDENAVEANRIRAEAPNSAELKKIEEEGVNLRQKMEAHQAKQDDIKKRLAIADSRLDLHDSSNFAKVSPVVDSNIFKPQMRPNRQVDEVRRLDPTKPLPGQVRRTNADLTRLAQTITDENGKPLVSHTRRKPLSGRDIERLNQKYPGVFDRYGTAIPESLDSPLARVDVPGTDGETALIVKPDPTVAGSFEPTDIGEVAAIRNEVAPVEMRATTREGQTLRTAKEGMELELETHSSTINQLEVEINSLQQRIEVVQNIYDDLRPYARGDISVSNSTREMHDMVTVNPNEFSPLRKYKPQVQTPADDFSRVAQETTWYHGSSIEVDPVDLRSVRVDLGGATDNELGAGLYLTNNPKLAETFARANNLPSRPMQTRLPLNENGFMYQTRFIGRRVIDGSVQAPENIRNMFKQVAREVLDDEPQVLAHYNRTIGRGTKEGKGMPLMNYWNQLRESYGRVTKQQISESVMQDFNRRIAELIGEEVDGVQYKMKNGDSVMAIYNHEIVWDKGTTRVLPIDGTRRMELPSVPEPHINARVARLQVETMLNDVMDTPVTRARAAEADLAHKNQLLHDAMHNYNRELNMAMQLTDQLDEVDRRLLQEVDEANTKQLNQNKVQSEEGAYPTVRKFDGESDSPCL